MGKLKGNRMGNTQWSNEKLVERGRKMVADELNMPYDEAKWLLLFHGSLKKAVDAYNNERNLDKK